MSEFEEILSVKEVCAILHISVPKMYRLITMGKLKAFDVGTGAERKHWRINKSDLMRFINGSANETN